jgi:hypothetical protein
MVRRDAGALVSRFVNSRVSSRDITWFFAASAICSTRTIFQGHPLPRLPRWFAHDNAAAKKGGQIMPALEENH